MILFCGNCQADGLNRNSPYDSIFVNLASPVQFREENIFDPGEENRILAESGLDVLFPGRMYLPQTLFPRDVVPSAFVFTLFHENLPVYRHKTRGYCLYLPEQATGASEMYRRYLEAGFTRMKVEPQGYFRRFRSMLMRARRMFPQVPFVVLKRFSHLPAYAPNPRSYPACGDNFWDEAFLRQTVLKNVDECMLLDMDRLLQGYLSESGESLDSVCPFLRFAELPEKDAVDDVAQRDLEHAADGFWRYIAERLGECLEQGAIYKACEAEPGTEELPGGSALTLRETDINRLLSADDKFAAAMAVHAALRQGRSIAQLLQANRATMPAFPMLLHMMKVYVHLYPDVRLLDWCRSHKERARDDFAPMGFSDGFIARYEEELGLLEQFLAG